METNKHIEEFVNQLKKVNIAKITSEMVQIPSYSFMENQEKEIAEYIDKTFKEEGIDSEIIEVRPGRFNVIATLKGKGIGSSLMFSGHIDTVPAYDMENPFNGEIRDGRVFGRGSVDMKGPVASMMASMIAMKRAGIELDGDLIFAALADEEEQARGAEYLVKHGPMADATIMGEPTDMKIAVGHKGLEWIRIDVKGKKVHGGDRANGINAIEMASKLINILSEPYTEVLNSREHPVLGVPTINIGKIWGGDQPSTFPGECTILLDRRCVISESIQQVYDELDEIINYLHQKDERFSAEVHDVFEGENLLPHTPFCISQDEELVLAVKESMENTTKTGEVVAFPAWSDAGFIADGSDSKCIVMGPGNLGVAHSVGEYIDIADMEEAAYIYGMTAIKYCNN